MSTENEMLTKVKTAMLLHVPFFASLLLDLMHVKVTSDPSLWEQMGLKPTAATNGKKIIFYEGFLNSLDIREAVFVMCHEIGHLMWMHMPRAKHYMDMGFEGQPFRPDIWNAAGDYIINDMLVKSQIGQMPKVGLHDSRFTSDMLTDDVYRALLQQNSKLPQPNAQGGQGQQGQPGQGQPGDKDGNTGSTLDVHLNSEPNDVGETELKRAVATAREAAKAMGKMPAALERLVEELINPKISWKDLLRHHVTRAVTREASTWTSPHRRRLVTQKVYLPSYTGRGAGEIVVVFDTSGSIGQAELQTFMSELADILDTCKPERVWLLSCDAKIYEDSIHELYEGHDLINHPPTMRGGGGTSFCPPFKWVDEEGIEPACLIYLTDMYGDFPDEPKYPVIWCATSDREGPFGETIHLNMGGA